MPLHATAFVFFLYGLAFFSMGLAVFLEMGRASDARLRNALRPLAGFGFLHGAFEWLEMFSLLGALPSALTNAPLWPALRLGLMAFSFVSLAAFGALLLAFTESRRRLSLLTPLVQIGVWAAGVLVMRGDYSGPTLWSAAEAWTRYILAVPTALLVAAGLVAQQRAFRQAGLSRFGRDSLWAAVAFVWYGVVGQVFTNASPLPPSTWLNHDAFLRWFGFPVQLARAGAAVMVAFFVIRFLRAFEVEAQRQVAALQAARLEEAERREAQRGELLRRIVEAQEAERQRVARELHDATGQSLTALGLGLRSATTLTRQDAEAAEKRLGQLEQMVAQALEELRRLIADLRPSHLDDLGLASTLRWYASTLQEHTPLKIHVDVQGAERPLDTTRKVALFRVAQEALTNVLKHSQATEAWVRLTYLSHEVVVQVRDNGRGVAPDATGARPTWGLLGMQERAELLNGRFSLRPADGGGTIVEVSVPG